MIYIVTPSFSKKFRFQIVFRPREKEKPAFSNSSRLKSVFEKLHFRDEIKQRFQIYPV